MDSSAASGPGGARRERVLATVRDAMIETDAEFRIVGWNRAAEEIYGWTREEVLGRNSRDVLRTKLVDTDRVRMLEELAGNGHVLTVATQWTKAGDPIQVEASVIVLQDEAGAVEGYVAVNRDVTERRRLEERVREADRLDAIGTLAGGVAHDLNSLMTAILGYADLLLAEPGLSDPVRADLEQIASATERAATMTQGLLAFGRRQWLSPRVLDLHALLSAMEGSHRAALGAGVELTYALGATEPLVEVDPEQFGRALSALVANACEAMPSGGSLTVATRDLDLDLPAGGPTRFVELALADTGGGMDEETRRRAFDPFFTTKGPGRGLGLASAHGIVVQSGGDMAAESSVQAGTVIRIRLPRAGQTA